MVPSHPTSVASDLQDLGQLNASSQPPLYATCQPSSMLGRALVHLQPAADMPLPDAAQEISSYAPVATATNSITRQPFHPGIMQLTMDSCQPLHELQPVIYNTPDRFIGAGLNHYCEHPALVTNLLGHGDVFIPQVQATGVCEVPLQQSSSDQMIMPGGHAAASTVAATSRFDSHASIAAQLYAWPPASTVRRADHLGMYTSSMEGYSCTSTMLGQAFGIVPGSQQPTLHEASQLSQVQYSSLGVLLSQPSAASADELLAMHQAAHEMERCNSLQTSDLRAAMIPRCRDATVKPATQTSSDAHHGAAPPHVPPERAEKTVFVAPLQSSITGAALAGVFAQCGTVVSAQVSC
jgi:hypothetical protein